MPSSISFFIKEIITKPFKTAIPDNAIKPTPAEIEKGIFNRARTNISLRRNKEQFLWVVLAEKHFSLIIPFIKDIPNEFSWKSKEEQELVKKMQTRIESYLSSLQTKVHQFLNFLCNIERCGGEELEIIFLNWKNK